MGKTLLLILSFLLTFTSVYAEEHNFNLIGMGNSIGAGTFSQIDAKIMPTDPDHPWWYSLILKFISSDSNSYLANIEARLNKDPSIEHGWKRHNLSVPGHDLEDVIRVQLPIATKLAQEKFSLVFIEAFANDVCADDLSGITDFRDYYSQMGYLVRTLMEETDALVVLIAAPDLSMQPDQRGNDSMWWPLNWLVGKYKDLWEKVGLCRTITSGQYRAEVRHQLEVYNAIMEGLVEVNAARMCYTYGSEMFALEKKWVSPVDGFHLSKLGQKELASRTYPFGTGTCTPPR